MIETLQSLRIVFALTVMLAHFSYAGIEGKSTGVGPMFFMLMTGFVMSRSYGAKVLDGSFEYGKFLLRRLFKFYPLHLLCLLIFIAIHRHTLEVADYQTLLPNLLLLQSWIPVTSFYFSGNAVSWYLSDLLFFLLLFPFLYKGIGRMSGKNLLRLVCGLLVIYVAYVSFIQTDDLNYWLYIFPPVRLLDFIWGMVMWRCYELYPMAGRWKHPTVIELVLIVGVVMTIITYPLHDRWHVALIHWLVLIPVVWVFMQGDRYGGWVSRLLKTRAMVWLGGLTLDTYLLHQLVFAVMMSNMAKQDIQLPYAVMLLICLTIVVFVSYITHTWFVNPINNRLLTLFIKKSRQ
ncbi:MAG: acyltransferase [Prevotella sp.]|nr:acyltransferase [Prevotella sp.]